MYRSLLLLLLLLLFCVLWVGVTVGSLPTHSPCACRSRAPRRWTLCAASLSLQWSLPVVPCCVCLGVRRYREEMLSSQLQLDDMERQSYSELEQLKVPTYLPTYQPTSPTRHIHLPRIG